MAPGSLAACDATEERIAAQLVEAEPTGDAGRVALLRRVASNTLARGAPAAAIALASFTRALSEPPPPESSADVLLELGSRSCASARRAASLISGRRWWRLTRGPEPMATAVRRLAITSTIAGHAERAVRGARGRDRCRRTERSGARATARRRNLDARRAGGTRNPGPGGRDGWSAVPRVSTGGRAGSASLSPVSPACARGPARRAREAAAHLEGALADEQFAGDQQAGLVGLGLSFDLSIGLIAAESLDLAETYIGQMLATAEAQAAILSVAYLTARRGLVALRRGAVATAEADGRTALEVLTSHRISLGVPFTLGALIEALVEGGELDSAERELGDRGLDGEIPPGPTSMYLLEARGLLRLAQGRAREGLDDLVEFGRRDEPWGLANPLASRWRSHAALGAGRDGRHRRGWSDGSRRPRSGASLGHGEGDRRRPAGGGADR